jgi:hypothetical protein
MCASGQPPPSGMPARWSRWIPSTGHLADAGTHRLLRSYLRCLKEPCSAAALISCPSRTTNVNNPAGLPLSLSQ